MAEAENLGQDDIEALLQAAQADQTPAGDAAPATAAKPAADASAPSPPSPAAAAPNANVDPDVQQLLNQAEQALASVDQPVEPDVADVASLQSFELQDFASTPPPTDKASLDLLSDVELNLKVELGRTYMHLQDVLQLRKGSVVQLDRPAGDPVDILVNGRLVARGEVLVLNDTFCIRVGELVSSNETD